MVIEAALHLASLGFFVFPCAVHGKAPLTEHGHTDASRDSAQIETWWGNSPRANIGIACTEQTGVLALDFDSPESEDEFEWKFGKLPDTPRNKTAAGAHYLFRHPTMHGNEAFHDGMHVRGSGYIIAPPSIHPSLHEYFWDRDPEDVSLAELPDRVQVAMAAARRGKRGSLPVGARVTGMEFTGDALALFNHLPDYVASKAHDIVQDAIRKVLEEGYGRHDAITSACARMRCNGANLNVMIQAAIPFLQQCQRPGDRVVTDFEVRRVAEWAMDHPAGTPENDMIVTLRRHPKR